MAKSNLAQDFVAGIDPFGIYTSEYGRRNQEAGISEAEHKGKQFVGILGGALGGGVLVPTITAGVARGVQASGGGGSFKQRLARIGAGFLRGAKEPWKFIQAARTSKALTRKAAKGGDLKLTDAEAGALKKLLGKASLGDVVEGVVNTKKPNKNLFSMVGGVVEDATSVKKLLKDNVLTQSLAKKIEAPVSTGYKVGISGLGIGGAVGAGGAAVQYSKGRQSERDFQKRLGATQMPKYSSAESAAFWASFDLEIDKIASASKIKNVVDDVAYAAGARARQLRDAVADIRNFKPDTYDEYVRGYQGGKKRPRTGDKKKEKEDGKMKARMYMLPLVAGLGSASGVLLSKGLKGSRGEDAYSRMPSRDYGETY